MSFERVIQLFFQADVDGDGQMTYNEFLEFFSDPSHIIAGVPPGPPGTPDEKARILSVFSRLPPTHEFFHAKSLTSVLGAPCMEDLLHELDMDYDRVIQVWR